MRQDDSGSDSKFRFDPTVKLGDVLTIVSLLAVVTAAWGNLDKRTALTEQAQATTTATVQEIRKDVKDIQSTVNEIRITRKEDRR